MERGSVQHGARLDEELADGVEALTSGSPISARDRADLDPEAPTDGEGAARGAPTDHEVILDRSELARWLLPSAFPADASTLVAVARDDDAPDWVVAALEGLDPTARFATFGETWLALGGTPETRASEPHDAPATGPIGDRPMTSTAAPAVAEAPFAPAEPAVAGAAEGIGAVITSVVRLVEVPVGVALAAGRRIVRTGLHLLPGH